MAQFFAQPTHNTPSYASPQNLQFYQSSYNNPTGVVSGHTTPAAAGGYGGFGGMGSMGNIGTTPGVGVQGAGGVAGERGGLPMGWLAAFGTGGYDDEPPLLEELGVNFHHIKGKVCASLSPSLSAGGVLMIWVVGSRHLRC
jgi:hypothetical protein